MANKRWKNWYNKNRERFNALVNKHKRQRRREMKEIIDERKKEPCIICKKNFPPEAMDLWHRDGEEKKFKISDAGRKIYNLDKLKEELSKCDVYCAICRIIVDREKFLNNEEGNIKRKNKLKDIVNKAKGVKCSDCGEILPFYVMELDHLGEKPKEGTINKMVRDGVEEEELLKEISKTEPVCIVCHRIRTNKRNQYGRKE
jgi:hypothetical protein